MSVKRLGHGRKYLRIKIFKAIEEGEGYKGFIVMIEGGRADTVPERSIIDSALIDSQGSLYITEEDNDEMG